MKLFLMRHGIAEERLIGGIASDGQRPLTEEGRAETRRVAQGLKKLGVQLDLVLSSPLTRARQTAEIVHAVLAVKRALKLTDHLAPGLSISSLYKTIHDEPEFKSIQELMLVGHEPDIGMIAANLLGPAEAIEIPFKKAGIMRVDVYDLPPSSPGRLKWFMTPKIATLIAK